MVSAWKREVRGKFGRVQEVDAEAEGIHPIPFGQWPLEERTELVLEAG